MRKNIFIAVFLIVGLFILFDINVNAAESLVEGIPIEEQYLKVSYFTNDYVNKNYRLRSWDLNNPHTRIALYYGDFTDNILDPNNTNNVIESTGKGYRLCVLRNEDSSKQYWDTGTYTCVNYDKDMYVTSTDEQYVGYDQAMSHAEIVPKSMPDWKCIGEYFGSMQKVENLTIDTNIPIFTDWDSLREYLETGYYNPSDVIVQIDWEHPQLNMSIGFLKNVVLKMDDVNHKKFTVSWTTDEELFMSDDWRIQIGFFTRFQKHLFGDKFIHTNLDYVTYDDELYYHLGKWKVNLDDVYDSIPDCNHPHYKGNFYLRLVHVDTSTGLVEFGPWGQLSWHLNQGNTEGLADIISEYKTIESSNVIEEEGTFDLIEEEYVVNTTHPDSQDYVINADKGTIGTEFGGINFSDVDLSNIGNTFMNGMSALGDTLKNFPTLMGKVASFLPKEIVTLITIGFALVIALRIWGR